MSEQLKIIFCGNLRRRLKDGFALGYNVIFPCILICLLGTLCKSSGAGIISSYSYYVITIIPFCIAMGIVTAAYACKNDAYENTAGRILASSIRMADIILGIVLSVTLVIGFCSVIVYCLLGQYFHVKIIPEMILFYISFSFCICSLGSVVGFSMKNFMVVKNIITIPIGICAGLAGTFYPIPVSRGILRTIMECSPFSWINRYIILAMTDGDHNPILLLSMISILLGGLFILATIKTFKKEEYINGTLPGYEK